MQIQDVNIEQYFYQNSFIYSFIHSTARNQSKDERGSRRTNLV
jgi:hypothetical protein